MPARPTSPPPAGRCSARTCSTCPRSRSRRTSTSACEYLERMSRMGMTLEIELGITGGEEDGVDNSDKDQADLYSKPEEVAYAYERLSEVSDRFTIAAAFGNVHGVYKPGNVVLKPTILRDAQEYIAEKFSTGPEAGEPGVPRRQWLDPRADRRGDQLRRGQDEHRHRPAVGAVGRHPPLRAGQARLPAGPAGQPERRRMRRTRSTTTRASGCGPAKSASSSG